MKKTTLSILAISTLLCVGFVQCTTAPSTAQALNPELYHQVGLLGGPNIQHVHCKQCWIGVIKQSKCSNCGRGK